MPGAHAVRPRLRLPLAAFVLVLAGLRGLPGPVQAAIEPAADAPLPLAPDESAKRFTVPDGFRVQWVASEPLIREPTGFCWDERGRLFVSELHGYNLEGHLDVQELNQTGVLDREVRRIPANPRAQEEALKHTYGTVKLLTDTDADGQYDQATVFADRIPPAYGLVPAREGLIVACAPDILFLADRDGDGRAEVREVLFTGFATGVLERAVNHPQWGVDNWIYFGMGHGGESITGPRLPAPVRVGRSDFRIRADGSAIEPIPGRTHTIGYAFTWDGERFVTDTSSPGRFVTPIPWRSLARNPDAAAPAADEDAGGDRRVYALAPPHPWRVRRAEDPGFYKFYRDRYGAGDSEASGWFTSVCSPLIYQDIAWPPEYHGAYLACEPAGSLVHRAVIRRDGVRLRLHRPPEDSRREFLASSDPWFHPIHLAHAPDGSVVLADFYREIIEDYSAIPRYLQQQYSLVAGQDHGRLWRLHHVEAPPAPAPDMSRLTPDELAREVGSPHFWRRQTARRLLVERQEHRVVPAISRWIHQAGATGGSEAASPGPAGYLNALYTLEGLGALTGSHVRSALRHPEPGIRKHALRFSEPWLRSTPFHELHEVPLARLVPALVDDPSPEVRFQLALTLGEAPDSVALPALATLARRDGARRWMDHAIASSAAGRTGPLLSRLLDADTGPPYSPGTLVVAETLAETLGAGRRPAEWTEALRPRPDLATRAALLAGLARGLRNARNLDLPEETGRLLADALTHPDPGLRERADQVAGAFRPADPTIAAARVSKAAREAGDLHLPAAVRQEAVERLAASDLPDAAAALVLAWVPNTPGLRAPILDALVSRAERHDALLDALEAGRIPPVALSAFQRQVLLDSGNVAIRRRAERLLATPSGADDATFRRFAAALERPRDPGHGEGVFREHCATCHRARGLGAAVGPDLDAEFQRAEEAILRDILAPNDTLTPGYLTFEVRTLDGETVGGTLASETATGITLRLPTGIERPILLKDIHSIRSLPVSLMPEALATTLEPQAVADVIAWLRGEKPRAPAGR